MTHDFAISMLRIDRDKCIEAAQWNVNEQARLQALAEKHAGFAAGLERDVRAIDEAIAALEAADAGEGETATKLP